MSTTTDDKKADALPRRDADVVYRIRPLQWNPSPWFLPSSSDFAKEDAQTSIGNYAVFADGTWNGPHGRGFNGYSFQAAKAAAEQHYLSRLLPALIPVTSDSEMREALLFYANPEMYEETGPLPGHLDGCIPIFVDAGSKAALALGIFPLNDAAAVTPEKEEVRHDT